MKIELICIEKTKKIEYKNIIQDYLKRINRKLDLTIKEITFVNSKKQIRESVLIKQANLIKKYINDKDYVVLLDEGGKSFSSINFSKWINQKISSGDTKCLKFIIGGPYGFNKKHLNLFHEKISFSKMTFSHQMIRIFVLEQIYRSLKIINNEPYHNE
ncbi:MAG: 23S rRNA (pseudouridine(1915)-N(3))-methyltransferase RlmH [Flavobacteriales bacterium TMED96]|nr:MAG: 23S rRNA (pseudouridine(1915)-N(3))-methyltransferase RlmH [Flavobacteriales bacterium TMED96]|tara:strand:- start:1575 stop:2048 length:474 start_codon:yes stop_codon:yes gene_type:complete